MGDERPGHGLGHAARRQRALGLARAILDRREHRLACMLTAREWRRWHLVDTNDAHHFLDDIGLTMNIRPPRWHCDFHLLALTGGEETELLERAAHVVYRHLEAGQARQLAQGEINDFFFRR